MELMIWAGGRWRRICPTSGRVEGWRRHSKFVCNRGGVLRELPPQSLLATIVKGPALPRNRKRKGKPLPVHVFNGSPTKSFLPTTTAQKITPLKDACIQTDTTDQMVAPKTLNTPPPPLVRIERCARIAQMLKDRDVHITVHFARQLGLRSVNDSDENDEIRKRKKIRAAKKVALSRSPIDSESDVEKGKKNKKANKNVGAKSSKNRNSSTENDIDQENLNKPSKTADKLIRETIDSDKEQSVHKKKVIPLLSSQSDNNETFVSSKLKDQIKPKVNKTTQDQSNLDYIRKKPTVENKVSNDDQKNANEKSEKKKKKFDLGKRHIVVPKRSSVPPGRKYSTLEDQAIVAWISAATQRERAVNGNRIWKELQEGYFKLTGQTRSWHSLRNRYLRYILPALGSLALPDAHARRLRAHATLGELKAHKKARRNSLLMLPAVRSAAARAPRPPLRSFTPKNIPESSSSESSESEPNKATNHTRSPSKVRQSRSPRSSPTYSELTRRFALRNRSTPLDSPTRVDLRVTTYYANKCPRGPGNGAPSAASATVTRSGGGPAPGTSASAGNSNQRILDLCCVCGQPN